MAAGIQIVPQFREPSDVRTQIFREHEDDRDLCEFREAEVQSHQAQPSFDMAHGVAGDQGEYQKDDCDEIDNFRISAIKSIVHEEQDEKKDDSDDHPDELLEEEVVGKFQEIECR